LGLDFGANLRDKETFEGAPFLRFSVASAERREFLTGVARSGFALVRYTIGMGGRGKIEGDASVGCPRAGRTLSGKVLWARRALEEGKLFGGAGVLTRETDKER
jgi:hypothetical protein